MIATEVLREHEQWFRREINAGEPRIIVGPVRSGKSTFFEWLADEQPHLDDGFRYVYWNMASNPPVPRRGASDYLRFSAAAVEAIATGDVRGGRTQHAQAFLLDGVDDVEDLRAPLSTALRRWADSQVCTVLILDEWDVVQEGDVFSFDRQACEELTTYCQDFPASFDAPPLSIVAISRFPSTTAMVAAARRVRGRFEAVSGWIERRFAVSRMPFLSKDAATSYARASGCPPEIVDSIIEDCGGWIGLINLALAKSEAANWQWDRTLRSLTMSDLDAVLLGKTLLTIPPNDTGRSPEDSWNDVLALVLPRGAEGLQDMGLPASWSNEAELVPLLRDHRRGRDCLVVDVENLCMGYILEFECFDDVRPRRYPNGIEDFCRTRLSAFVEWVRVREGIDPDAVILVTKHRARGEALLGTLEDERRSWRFVAPGDATDARRAKAGNYDDSTAIGIVAAKLAADPRSRVVVVSGDYDIPGIAWTALEEVGLGRDQVRLGVRALHGVAKGLQDTHEDLEFDLYQDFGLHKPKPVSNAQKRARYQNAPKKRPSDAIGANEAMSSNRPPKPRIGDVRRPHHRCAHPGWMP